MNAYLDARSLLETDELGPMAQRRASLSRTTRIPENTIFAATADVPAAEAEKWVAQWAHVLAKGASRSLLFMIAARFISYLNSIPNLILTYNRADLIDVRIVEVDADMSVEDAYDVSSTLGLVSTPDSLSLATSARRHSVSRCPYTSRFGSDRRALSWTI